MRSFLKSLGNPQRRLKNVIHIAGTNGKGSTLSFLESMLMPFITENNLKIAKYTSPHLVTVRERFRINGDLISDQDYTRLEKFIEEKASQYVAQSKSLKNKEILTFFEKLTALAFCFFVEKSADIVLLETGLGGRLDATNVINPALSLITSVSEDHQDYLGDSIEQIAAEKAGILKPDIPFITSAEGTPVEIIRQIAERIGAPEIPINTYAINYKKLGLKGRHQAKNARLAVSAYEYIMRNIFKTEPRKQDYLKIYEHQPWMGRFQEFNVRERKVILDGAHNLQGAIALDEALREYYPDKKRIWLMGFLKTKNSHDMIKRLLLRKDTVIFTYPTQQDKSRDLEELALYAKDMLEKPPILMPELSDALRVFKAKISDEKDSIGIISGSLYLIGNILPELGVD